MILIPLQSGSNGNCIFVETKSAKILFDAGISPRSTGERLAAFGRNIYDIDAVVISHEHSDHIRYAEGLARKYQLPVYITEKTFNRAKKRYNLHSTPVTFFRSGSEFRLGTTLIKTIATPHDAVDGNVFVIEEEHKRIGVFTDLGHVFSDLEITTQHLDGLYIESNYDPEMLKNGDYPAALKRRISGKGGHISNRDAARLVAKFGVKLQWVCLGHLSEQNNTPQKTLQTFAQIAGLEIPVALASRYEAGPVFTVQDHLFTSAPNMNIQKKQPHKAAVYDQLSLFQEN